MSGIGRSRMAWRGAVLPVMLGALLTGAAGAFAQQPTEQCDVLFDIAEGAEPSLYRVAASRSRLHFYMSDSEETGCPRLDAACEAHTYLIAGDPVIVTEITGDFACAGYAASKGARSETMGWLPRAALEEIRAPAPAPRDWLGHWRASWRDIKITAAPDGGIELDGTAYWGASDPERRARGAVNTGDLSATVKPEGGKAAFSLDVNGEVHAYDAADMMCRVRLWRLGPYLAATDDVQCGGANVTFNGIYRRER